MRELMGWGGWGLVLDRTSVRMYVKRFRVKRLSGSQPCLFEVSRMIVYDDDFGFRAQQSHDCVMLVVRLGYSTF